MKRITKIKANEPALEKPKKKVAAYCRVSTASDEQLISLAVQKAHYEKTDQDKSGMVRIITRWKSIPG